MELPSHRPTESDGARRPHAGNGLYGVRLQTFYENPSEQIVWRTDLYPYLWKTPEPEIDLTVGAAEELSIMRQVCLATTDKALSTIFTKRPQARRRRLLMEGQNAARTARTLGIARSTLYQHIKGMRGSR